MRKYNTIIVLCAIGIVTVLLSMGLATYAYFTVEVTGTGVGDKLESIDETDMSIRFADTSTITLSNAYTGDQESKAFTITNEGSYPVYYDIYLEDLLNSFINHDDLVYTIASNDGGGNKNQTIVPWVNVSVPSDDEASDNVPILTHIKIGVGVTHSYTLIVKFLRTDADQSNNMNRTFSAKINIKGSDADVYHSEYLYNPGTLGNAVLTANPIIDNPAVDYTVAPINSGLYSTNNTIDGTTVYYFRGNTSLNNNVLFSGFCWKIMRTTEDLGIRLVYNGTPNDNNCINSIPAETSIPTQTSFNTTTNFNAYVGYKYGVPSSSSYSAEHNSTNNSTVKGILSTWYTANLERNELFIEDSYYCNNRKVRESLIDGLTATIDGYDNHNTPYDTFYRYTTDDTTTGKPTLNCENYNDIFTVTDSRGNASGDKPIALPTVDELVLSGFTYNTANTNAYLYNGGNYWTMSPAYFLSNKAYNYIVSGGTFDIVDVNTSSTYVRPVITLKKDTMLISGDGTTTTPYKITNN